MSARVSCVVTAFDVAPFVAAAIESALAQDYEGDVEVIVVDDGSTDGTAEIVDGFADSVRILHQPNSGVAAATQRGLAEATGEYVAALDGDDLWPPDKVRVQARYLDAHPEVGLVHGDMEIVDRNGALLHPSYFAHHGFRPSQGDVYGTLVRYNVASGGASMFRSSLRHRIEPIPAALPWQDWWIALRIGEVARFGYVDQCVNRYRVHDRNKGYGVEGARLARSRREEIAVRRHVLAHLAHTRCSLEDLLHCHALLESQAVEAAAAARDRPADGIPVSKEDAARSAAAYDGAAVELAAGRHDAAGRRLCEALGHDPFNGRARLELHALAAHLARSGCLAAGARPLPPPVGGVRRFRAVASALVLRERPELLSAFADAFGPDDDATLVVHAADAADAAAIEKAANALPRCPDVVLLPGFSGDDPFPFEVHAVLGDVADPAELRARYAAST